MSTRPYFNLSGGQLFELFEGSKDDLQTLKRLHAELQHRSTRKMRDLFVKVEARLAADLGGAKPEQPTRATASSQSQQEFFVPEALSGAQVPGDEDDGGDGDEVGHSSSDNTADHLPPDDRRRPSKYTLIQHPGIGGRPSKYAPVLASDRVLEIPAGASNAKRFSIALDALVAEMKARGTGSRNFVLSDGAAIDLGTDDFGYVFDFEEDIGIFEDVQVQVFLGSRQSLGSVVSLLPGKIILALDTNLGPRIRTCVLKVDSTALLVALKERLDSVEQKTLNLNTPLADAVLSDDPGQETSDSLDLPDLDDGLNPRQEEAIRQALRRRVFFLWGPPGTGKTFTLAVLVRALIDAGKRVLICSNTNQAVDQLLFTLCEHLGTDHPALAQGKILRQGRVEPKRLGKYEEFLLIDKIVERLSHDLRERRRSLQARIAEVEASLTRVDGVLRLFDAHDSASREIGSMEAEIARRQKTHRRVQSELDAATRELRKAEGALEVWRMANRLRRLFMLRESRLKRQIGAASRLVLELTAKLQPLATAVGEATTTLRVHRTRATDLEREIAIHDRGKLLAEQKMIKAERNQLREELATVEAQLTDLERSLLAAAKIIGTTVTRAYLSAKDLGVFDAVIVDEASMVMLPALYFVAGLASERVTISGDFYQLPPIVQSDQEAILDSIGGDVFAAAGITEAYLKHRGDPRVVMLNVQRRMVPAICELVREGMPYGDLKTDLPPERSGRAGPQAPFDDALTVVDSSRLWPFESRNLLNSRFNLMHTLLVRNLCWHLDKEGFIKDQNSLGVCTPYSAQAKLLSEILKGENLFAQVTASTVHRYQGDERQVMLLDIPESIGSGFNIGRFIQADQPDDDGAKLLNVALSRTEDHLIILANLTYLDAKLPSNAKLRFYLYEIQKRGKVVEAGDVLALRPIVEDLRRYGGDPKIDWNADDSGVFRQEGFDRLFQRDVAQARKSVAIFSGFVTPQRVGAYGDLFRRKIAEGVVVRCVTRPPQNNGSIKPEETKRALDSLEGIGVIVDTRWVIHEKVVIVDDEIGWFGSLNPLSHTSRTDELMTRVVSKGWASKLASLLSVVPGEGTLAVRKENPTHCGGRTCYLRGKWGPYFKCESCGHNQNLFRRQRPTTN